MIFEGIKLMFVGMGTVILFLCLMILLLQFVSKLAQKTTVREYEALELERKLLAEAAKARRKRELEQSQLRQVVSEHKDDDQDDIAVIAAAISAFEADKLRSC